jgi:serine/threonine protein kinase
MLLDLIRSNQRQALPITYKKDLRDLVDKLLTIDISQRISTKEIIHTSAFRDLPL